MNLFDGIQNAVFNTVTATFGYEAAWTPSSGGLEQKAQILFKDPTDQINQQRVEFDADSSIMEYQLGDLVGLKEAVDRKQPEVVTINGIEYGVLQVKKKFDGKTFIADLVVND